MTKLNDIADIRTGYNPRSTSKTNQQTIFTVSAKDLAEDFTNVDKNAIPSSFDNYLRDGDILVKSHGINYEAKVFRSRDYNTPFIALNTLITVRVTVDWYKPEYIAQIINSGRSQQLLRSLSSGATVSVLSPSSLGTLLIPEAPLEKQEQLDDITKIMDEYHACLTQYQKASKNLTKAIGQLFMEGVK